MCSHTLCLLLCSIFIHVAVRGKAEEAKAKPKSPDANERWLEEAFKKLQVGLAP